jgi:hypothetical protein
MDMPTRCALSTLACIENGERIVGERFGQVCGSTRAIVSRAAGVALIVPDNKAWPASSVQNELGHDTPDAIAPMMSSTAGAFRSPAFSVNSMASPAATKASLIVGFEFIYHYFRPREELGHSRDVPV